MILSAVETDKILPLDSFQIFLDKCHGENFDNAFSPNIKKLLCSCDRDRKLEKVKTCIGQLRAFSQLNHKLVGLHHTKERIKQCTRSTQSYKM